MGFVYRARDTRLSRRVALKLLGAGAASESSEGSQASSRLLREARAAAAFSHPNVVAIFDVGEADGAHFIVMELVQGRTLRQLQTDRALDWSARLGLVVQVARGLAAAHAAGLVHRDIKPDNVMVRADGTVKILDFGIARRSSLSSLPASDWDEREVLSTLTAEGAIVGTPAYMAPEQLFGGVIDGRSDQYAWGLLAYELFAGALPWTTALGGIASIVRARREPPGDLAAACPELPTAVTRTVHRALAIEQEARFSSMDAIVDVLAPLVSSDPSPVVLPMEAERRASPDSETLLAPASSLPRMTAPTLGPTVRSLRRRVRPWMALALFLLALSSLGLPSVRARLRHSREPAAYADALSLFHRGSLDPMAMALTRATEQDPTFSPASLRLALLTPAGPTARAALRSARANATSLPPSDRALLDASEAGAQPMPDLAAWDARLSEVAKRWPGEASYVLGLVRTRRGDAEGALAAFDEAMRASPELAAPSYAQRADALLGRHRLAEAKAALDACLAVSSGATSCLERRARLLGSEGDCRGMERDTRAWSLSDPSSPDAEFQLASALAALNAPDQEVRAHVEACNARLPPTDRSEEAWNELRLAMMQGDFPAAIAAGQRYYDSVPSSASRLEHYAAAVFLAGTAREAGDDALAVKICNEYLKRSEAWPIENPRDASLGILFLTLSHRAGGLTDEEFVRVRARWIAASDQAMAAAGTTPDSRARQLPWITGYVMNARTKEDALEALSVLPKFGELPAPSTSNIDRDVAMGGLFLLAGRPSDARPYLEPVASGCHALEMPNVYLRGRFLLARLREGDGDREGARSLYADIVRRWGAKVPMGRDATDRLEALTRDGQSTK
jgi:serine/threonine-protein kinase